MDSLFSLFDGDAIDVGDEIEILKTGHEIIEFWVVWDVGHFLLAADWVSLHGDTVDEDLAFVELKDASAGFESGGFSSAVMADETVYFAWGDVDAEIVYGLLFSVGFGEVFD